MPKKKFAKRTKMKKTNIKAAVHKNVLSLAEKVEKEFRQIPMKLAKLYRQELTTLKQQEKTLKGDLKNALITQKTAQKKQTTLANGNQTKTSKKQLAATKKTLGQVTKTIKTITQQLALIHKTSMPLLAKQIKYTAMSKELAKLEKDLTKKMKASKPALPKKTKVKTTKSKTTRNVMNITEDLAEKTTLMSTSPAEPVVVE